MLTYSCDQCGMQVTNLTCGKCGAALEHKTLERDGNAIGVSECPAGCGRIKSPMCCGSDMEAAA